MIFLLLFEWIIQNVSNGIFYGPLFQNCKIKLSFRYAKYAIHSYEK